MRQKIQPFVLKQLISTFSRELIVERTVNRHAISIRTTTYRKLYLSFIGELLPVISHTDSLASNMTCVLPCYVAYKELDMYR
ncbi:hypothetical protein Plhal304r1_c005g0021001 [Plasmopara halstedii]